MKFVNRLISGVGVVVLLTLSGCASQVSLPGVGEQVELMPTAQYIPKKSIKEGKELIYVPSENPYLSERSKVNKGSVLLFIEAKKAKRNNKLSLAKQKLGVITQKDDSLSGPWAMLGDIALEQKDLTTAESHYKKAIKINDKNINAYTALATVQRMMGEFHVAQNTLALALELWPDFPEAHLNLGILYDVYLNQPKQAQAHMEAYLFLTGYKNKQAQAWFDEVKSRTGIQTSFIVDKSESSKKSSVVINDKEAEK